MQSETYTVLEDGFLFGDFQKKGATIKLNAKQARRFVMEGRIALAAKPAAPAPKPAPAKGKAD